MFVGLGPDFGAFVWRCFEVVSDVFSFFVVFLHVQFYPQITALSGPLVPKSTCFQGSMLTRNEHKNISNEMLFSRVIF